MYNIWKAKEKGVSVHRVAGYDAVEVVVVVYRSSRPDSLHPT